MRIATVVGNRPQFVKAAAVSARLRERHEELLVHTGQHHDDQLSRVFFDELGIPAPAVTLGLGGGSNLAQTARMIAALEPVLSGAACDAVMVYGDTNSTLAAALVAASLRIPLIHVEAGMRSFDRTMPEEVNRVLCDHVSGLCLCSTPVAVHNLESEGLTGVLVGDVMADVALTFSAIAAERSDVLARLGLVEAPFALVTAHRAGNVDDPARLGQLVSLLEALPLPLVFPVHPRTSARLRAAALWDRLAGAPHVTLTEPVGYLDLLELARNARVVLTDSGGLQKEAYVLGTPCVTLRDRTEWVETVEAGWNTLVDLSAAGAVAAVGAVAGVGAVAALERGRGVPSERPDFYRAGRAAAGVVDAITAWTPALR
jgi:UDP-N-acetylglucosamine 2-epimerase (non-hydrolysing)/UDP-GlcNAc3NAcA epimerase